jgi:hypothetical protein
MLDVLLHICVAQEAEEQAGAFQGAKAQEMEAGKIHA